MRNRSDECQMNKIERIADFLYFTRSRALFQMCRNGRTTSNSLKVPLTDAAIYHQAMGCQGLAARVGLSMAQNARECILYKGCTF